MPYFGSENVFLPPNRWHSSIRTCFCVLSPTPLTNSNKAAWWWPIAVTCLAVAATCLPSHSVCTAPLWLFEPLGGVLLLRHSGSLLGRPKGLEIIYQVSKVGAALFFLSVHPSPQPKEERAARKVWCSWDLLALRVGTSVVKQHVNL